MIHSLQPPGKNERESCLCHQQPATASLPAHIEMASPGTAGLEWSLLNTENSNAFSPLQTSPLSSSAQLLLTLQHIVYTGGYYCLSHLAPRTRRGNISDILITELGNNCHLTSHISHLQPSAFSQSQGGLQLVFSGDSLPVLGEI